MKITDEMVMRGQLATNGLKYGLTDAKMRAALEAAVADVPEPTPEAEKPVAWCQPNYEGKIHPRKFMVVYEDSEMGNAVFDDEAEAREYFEKASIAWNCYLFGLLPALAAPAPEAVKAKDQLIRKSGQVAIDELIDRMDGKHPGNHDLADYLGRIVDACVRAALNAEGK